LATSKKDVKTLEKAQKELLKIAKFLINESAGSIKDVEKLIGEAAAAKLDKAKLETGLIELKGRLKKLAVHPHKI
jgi:intein-encoded DNA endonuclease-like protein